MASLFVCNVIAAGCLCVQLYRTAKQLKAPIDIAVDRVISTTAAASATPSTFRRTSMAPATLARLRRHTAKVTHQLLQFWTLFGLLNFLAVMGGIGYTVELRALLLLLSVCDRLLSRGSGTDESWTSLLFDLAARPAFGRLVPRVEKQARVSVRRTGAVLAPTLRACSTALLPLQRGTADTGTLAAVPAATLRDLESALVASAAAIITERRRRRRAQLMGGAAPSRIGGTSRAPTPTPVFDEHGLLLSDDDAGGAARGGGALSGDEGASPGARPLPQSDGEASNDGFDEDFFSEDEQYADTRGARGWVWVTCFLAALITHTHTRPHAH